MQARACERTCVYGYCVQARTAQRTRRWRSHAVDRRSGEVAAFLVTIHGVRALKGRRVDAVAVNVGPAPNERARVEQVALNADEARVAVRGAQLQPAQKVGHGPVGAAHQPVHHLGQNFLGAALEEAVLGVEAHAVARINVKGAAGARRDVDVVGLRAEKVARRVDGVKVLEYLDAAVEGAGERVARALAVAVGVLLARDVVADARDGVARARREARNKVAHGARLVLRAARDGVALHEAVGVVVEAVEGVGSNFLRHGDVVGAPVGAVERLC